MKIIAEEDRQQAERGPGRYRVVWNENGETVYVKDADFFEQQGGLTEKWGKRWIEIQANSINDAREKGHELRRIEQGNR